MKKMAICALSALIITSSTTVKTEWNPWVVGSVATGVGAAYYFTSGIVGRFLLNVTEGHEKDYRLVRDDEKTDSEEGYKKLKKQILRNNSGNYPLKSYKDYLSVQSVLLWFFMLPNWFNEDGNKMSNRMKKLCYITGVVGADTTLRAEERDYEAKKERKEIKDLLKKKKV